jgi:3-dehydroquinate dehydratase II
MYIRKVIKDRSHVMQRSSMEDFEILHRASHIFQPLHVETVCVLFAATAFTTGERTTPTMPRILILNGPNLNLLGTREPAIYGGLSLDEMMQSVQEAFPTTEIVHFQSNLEGELVEAVQKAKGCYGGVVMNAGGFAHTSVALRDAVAYVDVPVVEVHITNLLAREPFRHTSLVGAVCVGGIMGLGGEGYHLAVRYLLERA